MIYIHIHIFSNWLQEIDALSINNHTEEGNSEELLATSEVASCSKQQDVEKANSQDRLVEKRDDQCEESKKSKLSFRK